MQAFSGPVNQLVNQVTAPKRGWGGGEEEENFVCAHLHRNKQFAHESLLFQLSKTFAQERFARYILGLKRSFLLIAHKNDPHLVFKGMTGLCVWFLFCFVLFFAHVNIHTHTHTH